MTDERFNLSMATMCTAFRLEPSDITQKLQGMLKTAMAPYRDKVVMEAVNRLIYSTSHWNRGTNIFPILTEHLRNVQKEEREKQEDIRSKQKKLTEHISDEDRKKNARAFHLMGQVALKKITVDQAIKAMKDDPERLVYFTNMKPKETA